METPIINNPFEAICQQLTRLEKMILALNKDPEEEEWMTLDQLREYLPGKPSKSTLYGKVSKGVIPHRKYAKKLIFSKAEIDQWLKDK